MSVCVCVDRGGSIHVTAGSRIEASNYLSCVCLKTARFGQGQVSFRVKIQSFHLLLSASKTWRSEFDVKLRVDRWVRIRARTAAARPLWTIKREHMLLKTMSRLLLDGKVIGICMPK